MTRYAVIGASSGTGLAIVKYLSETQTQVRAISRHPPKAGRFIEPYAADVTDACAINEALKGEFSAIFYTVDIHGLFNSRQAIRKVMYQGCVNAIQAAARAAPAPKFILLSVIGPDRPSWVWWMLNSAKRGMKQNVIDRERTLHQSGLPYIICRAPKLGDGAGDAQPLAATPPQHKLDMSMGITRIDLAKAMVLAAQAAPVRTTWDVFADTRGPSPHWLQPAASHC